MVETGITRVYQQINSHVKRSLFSFCFLYACASCFAQPVGIVIEPYRLISGEISFEGNDVDMKLAERVKLEALVQSIFKTYKTPVHECDFDTFIFEGYRGSESDLELERLDLLFEHRVANIKKNLSFWGIPESIGNTIKPSETQSYPESRPNNVAIVIRHWIHPEGRKYEPSHLDCKWSSRQ